MKTKLFLSGLMIMATTAIMSAQTPGQGQGRGRCNCTGRGAAFVDNNKNGVCDNYENRTATLKGNRTGNRTGKANTPKRGRNFVDANKNGICDRAEATPVK